MTATISCWLGERAQPGHRFKGARRFGPPDCRPTKLHQASAGTTIPGRRTPLLQVCVTVMASITFCASLGGQLLELTPHFYFWVCSKRKWSGGQVSAVNIRNVRFGNDLGNGGRAPLTHLGPPTPALGDVRDDCHGGVQPLIPA